MRLKRRAKINTYLDIAPLIDCVFLLLIFFLLTSSFVKQQGFTVNLPTAANANAVGDNYQTIYLSSEKEMFFNGERISFVELEKKLTNSSQQVLIRADRDVRLNEITKIMDLAKAAGINQISIATVNENGK